MNKDRLCVNCKHYWKQDGYEGCDHPDNASPVNGRPLYSASVVRMGGRCGIDGAWFEAGENPHETWKRQQIYRLAAGHAVANALELVGKPRPYVPSMWMLG